MQTLEESLGLRPLPDAPQDAPGGWQWSEAEVGEEWTIHSVVNGGLSMMLGALAALRAAPDHPHPISVTGRYLGQVNAGPVRVRFRSVARSRRFSTLEAFVTQAEAPDGEQQDLVWLQITATDLGYGGLDRLERQAPQVPPPQDCSWPDPGKLPGSIRDRVHQCFAPGGELWERSPENPGSSVFCGWIGVTDGAGGYQRLGHCASLLLCDAVPPALFGWQGPIGWAPTLEMTVQPRRAPATASGMLRFRLQTLYATNGYAEEDVELWDDEGLVAMSRQLLAVPKKPVWP